MGAVRKCLTRPVRIFFSVAWWAASLMGYNRAVADLGQAWEKVSVRVGRMSADCRDRYRNHLANREVRVSGTFQPVFFESRMDSYVLFFFRGVQDTGRKRRRRSLLASLPK
jgi:hypothetical protein